MSRRDSDPDSEHDVEVEAVDVDEMVRRKRLRSIFQAQSDCREARTNAKNRRAAGETEVARVMFRSALETYVREVEPLFSQTEQGRKYWTEYDFGSVVVSPEVEQKRSRRRGGGSRKTLAKTGSQIADEVPSKEFDLTGLGCVFDVPSPISFEAECLVTSSGWDNSYDMETVTVTRHLPINKLDEMYAVTNGYLGEIGIGIDVNISDPTADADYSDVV